MALHDWFPWWFPNLAREPLVQTGQKLKTSGTTGNHLWEPLVQSYFQPLKPHTHILEGDHVLDGGTAIARYGIEGNRQPGRD